ncbi:glycoside hydrolase family 25 protein [Amycolatopsis thailandensis]|uniref:glycoside hydrolase family 25 protein n=1 Tax=Amycolatopsis thailandensis TaxID=589330 RepID=UPI0037B37B55
MADPITFVIDISHHQDKRLDLAQTRRDGCELCLMKAGEGGTFVDEDFASNLAEARAAGQLVGAYWYQRASASAAAHVAKIKQVVPKDVPVILDVEHGSGGIALTREIIRLLNADGYRTPLLYIPRWYWQQLGSPSLAGLPPLWSSRYPDNVVGTLADEWADVPAHYWNGYGGLDVLLLQFTSSARIAGYQPLDASAFRGTRAHLAARLGQNAGGGGGAPAPAPTDQGVDLMERRTIPASKATTSVRLLLPGSPGAAIIVRPRINSDGVTEKPVWQGNIYAWGSDKVGVGGNPLKTEGFNPKTVSHRRYALAGAVWADFEYSSDAEFEIDIVG